MLLSRIPERDYARVHDEGLNGQFVPGVGTAEPRTDRSGASFFCLEKHAFADEWNWSESSEP
jgi:hypothetical protein